MRTVQTALTRPVWDDLIAELPVGVVLMDARGDVLAANRLAAGLLGLRPSELMSGERPDGWSARDCLIFGSGTEEVVPTGSAEQDPLAQQGEAGASVHLPLQEFELGVGALDRAVAVRQAQPGDDGVEVLA